jgi:hypothetical protein
MLFILYDCFSQFSKWMTSVLEFSLKRVFFNLKNKDIPIFMNKQINLFTSAFDKLRLYLRWGDLCSK